MNTRLYVIGLSLLIALPSCKSVEYRDTFKVGPENASAAPSPSSLAMPTNIVLYIQAGDCAITQQAGNELFGQTLGATAPKEATARKTDLSKERDAALSKLRKEFVSGTKDFLSANLTAIEGVSTSDKDTEKVDYVIEMKMHLQGISRFSKKSAWTAFWESFLGSGTGSQKGVIADGMVTVSAKEKSTGNTITTGRATVRREISLEESKVEEFRKRNRGGRTKESAEYELTTHMVGQGLQLASEHATKDLLARLKKHITRKTQD